MTRKTEVITTETPEKFHAAVELASDLLQAGEVVALPTETVYGLAANAQDAAAVARIYEAKGRPAHNPVIVHVSDLTMARRSASSWPPLADALARRYWPGPLTLVVGRTEAVPDIVTAGGETVGLRQPRHKFFEAVIRRCGFPLAAPSANASNRLSPTIADHVLDQLNGRIPLIVDGGACAVGIESTVVDATGAQPIVLRPGMIGADELAQAWAEDRDQAAAPEVAAAQERGDANAPLRSPGQLSRHYAPTARLLLLRWDHSADLSAQLREREIDPAQACLLCFHHDVPSLNWRKSLRLPQNPDQAARDLYASLHQADSAGADWIIAEQPPNTAGWRAITDRLRRAAAS